HWSRCVGTTGRDRRNAQQNPLEVQMSGSNLLKGMVAGFVAKAVLSALMVMKSLMGVMLELDVIAMLAKMIHARPAARGA
ncbi:MAG: hypothetical protein PSV22_18930, partial [Pseudolabrys sp.]|nr:hypothetical protein [Pseudolabrys sp.]